MVHRLLRLTVTHSLMLPRPPTPAPPGPPPLTAPAPAKGFGPVPTTGFGIAAWVNIVPSTGTSSRLHTLFTVLTYSSVPIVTFGLSDPEGGFFFSVYGAQCMAGGGTSIAVDGTWHHVAATWTLSNRSLRYVRVAGSGGAAGRELQAQLLSSRLSRKPELCSSSQSRAAYSHCQNRESA